MQSVRELLDMSVPRMCGDDPEVKPAHIVLIVCSPHVRG